MFDIGNSLRAARERQGLGYPEVELATKIRGKYIRALEEEDFDSLPGDAYIRGFLRSYADYLGLDGEIYVEEYASRFITSWRDDVPPPPSRRRRTRRERTIERRAVVLALVGIAAVMALVFAAWRFGGTSGNEPLPGRYRGGSGKHELVLRGVGQGTYLVIRRGSRSGAVLFRGTLSAGGLERLTGTRFYVFARRPAGAQIARLSAGVRVHGTALGTSG